MQVPVSWLTDYVRCNLSPNEIAALLNSAGIEVSAVTKVGGWGTEVTVGTVTAIRPHPNADRLRLVTVDNGVAVREVVCGAPNVEEGIKIAFAAPGAMLHDPRTGERNFHLQPATIRGVKSEGMVCSEKELGLGDEHDGILVLDADAPQGAALDKVLGDHVLKVEPTPNRSDCFGVIGIAREIAVLTSQPLTLPELDYPEDGAPVEQLASATIEDPELCRRFHGGVIQGITIAPSPEWLQRRLKLLGERPINNVVDITNYVMLEIGQPLHAFDYNLLDNGAIAVRTARKGEALTTLDGNHRELREGQDLLITSGGKPAALAGIMGGADTAISEGTANLLLEAANFQGPTIRRASHHHRLRTEASLRFEKGLHPESANRGIRRAMRLLLQIAGGTAAKGLVDTHPAPSKPAAIHFPRAAIQSKLGIELNDLKVGGILESLGFKSQPQNGGWQVTPPYWRLDAAIPEDLCEELARITGYNTIPAAPMPSEETQHLPQPQVELRRAMLDAAIAAGMQQVISYSALAEQAERLNGGGAPAKLRNPISADFAVLRTSLKASLLAALQHNINHGAEGRIAIVEAGAAYAESEGGFLETQRIAAAIAVSRKRSEAQEAAERTIYELKGVAEELLKVANAQHHQFQAAQEDTPLFTAGRWASIGEAGDIGEVKPSVLLELGINRSSIAQDLRSYAVAILELDLNALAPQQ